MVGNGGSRLEQIIKKSSHFVKNLELGYLEGEANLFSHNSSGQRSAERKLSDSGYSSQFSSAFEGEQTQQTGKISELKKSVYLRCLEVLDAIIDSKKDTKADFESGEKISKKFTEQH